MINYGLGQTLHCACSQVLVSWAGCWVTYSTGGVWDYLVSRAIKSKCYTDQEEIDRDPIGFKVKSRHVCVFVLFCVVKMQVNVCLLSSGHGNQLFLPKNWRCRIRTFRSELPLPNSAHTFWHLSSSWIFYPFICCNLVISRWIVCVCVCVRCRAVLGGEDP